MVQKVGASRDSGFEDEISQPNSGDQDDPEQVRWSGEWDGEPPAQPANCKCEEKGHGLFEERDLCHTRFDK